MEGAYHHDKAPFIFVKTFEVLFTLCIYKTNQYDDGRKQSA